MILIVIAWSRNTFQFHTSQEQRSLFPWAILITDQFSHMKFLTSYTMYWQVRVAALSPSYHETHGNENILHHLLWKTGSG